MCKDLSTLSELLAQLRNAPLTNDVAKRIRELEKVIIYHRRNCPECKKDGEK